MATDQVVLRRPKFDLRFVTEETEFHIKYDAKTPDNNFMTESVISMTAKNALEDDTSAFSFVLAGDMEWDKILNENDLVILSVDPNEYNPRKPYEKDQARNNTIVMGLVSEVRIEGSYSDDSKMYRITGQSFQKAFANFELRSIRQAGHATSSKVGWMDWNADEGSGFAQQLMSKTVTGVAWELVKRFREYMEYDFVGDEEEQQNLNDFFTNQIIYSFNTWELDEQLLNPIPVTSFEGSLNQLIKEVAAPPFIEYFFEVSSGYAGYEKVRMVIRRTPFDKEDWEKLDTYVLRTRDVISENYGRTDLDAYSIYNLVPEMENEDQALANAVPWYNPKLITKYGYKMLEVSSRFFNFASEAENEDNEDLEGAEVYENSVAAQYGKKLYEWYANNPNFYAGEITVIGHPDYRVGNRLVYRNNASDEVWEFYIESVEHSYAYDAGFTTTLGVTRGLRVKDIHDHGVRFDPPMGPAERFKGGYLDEMSLQELEDHRQAEAAKLQGGGGGNQVAINNSGIVRPAEGRVTSEYGYRTHPITGEWKLHAGTDIAGGGLDVRAMAGGVVIASRHHASLGNYVEIDHGALNGKGHATSLYAHLARRDVSAGTSVMGGQKLGSMGATGAVTGVHLHFEVKVDGSHVNPREWVDF